jgi:hypothetical protein
MERVETVYTYAEWCRLAERHGKKIIKRYTFRKLRDFLQLAGAITLFYLIGSLAYFLAYQSNLF